MVGWKIRVKEGCGHQGKDSEEKKHLYCNYCIQ